MCTFSCILLRKHLCNYVSSIHCHSRNCKVTFIIHPIYLIISKFNYVRYLELTGSSLPFMPILCALFFALFLANNTIHFPTFPFGTILTNPI